MPPPLPSPRGRVGWGTRFWVLGSGFWVLLAGACAAQETPKKPKGKDGPGDAERRAQWLAGASAAEAKALVETNNPLHIDAVARFFKDDRKPYAERLAALRALQLLREQDEEEYKRVYPEVKTALSLEASRGLGSESLKETQVEMLLAAVSWHADMKYDHARMALEHYVDTEVNRVRTSPVPDRVRIEAARLLVTYAPKRSSQEVLWGALIERWERDALRQACYESLKAFDPNLRDRILGATPSPKDAWFLGLQKRVREKG